MTCNKIVLFESKDTFSLNRFYIMCVTFLVLYSQSVNIFTPDMGDNKPVAIDDSFSLMVLWYDIKIVFVTGSHFILKPLATFITIDLTS